MSVCHMDGIFVGRGTQLGKAQKWMNNTDNITKYRTNCKSHDFGWGYQAYPEETYQDIGLLLSIFVKKEVLKLANYRLYAPI